MRQHSQQPSGFHCPLCSGFIPISMRELILNSGVECPLCGLQLRINREASRSAIAALERVKLAQENVEKASFFRR